MPKTASKPEFLQKTNFSPCVPHLILMDNDLSHKKPIFIIFVDLIIHKRSKMTQFSNFALQIQMSRNEFYVEIFENLWVNIKMYMIEVSRSKISDLKLQKMIILWTLNIKRSFLFCSTNCSPAYRQGNTKKNEFYKYYTSLTKPLNIEHNKNTF